MCRPGLIPTRPSQEGSHHAQRPQRGGLSDHVHSLKTRSLRLGQCQARRKGWLRVRPWEPRPRAVCEAAAEPGSAVPARTVTPQGQATCAQRTRPRLSQPVGQEPSSPPASESEENRAWTAASRAQQPPHRRTSACSSRLLTLWSLSHRTETPLAGGSHSEEVKTEGALKQGPSLAEGVRTPWRPRVPSPPPWHQRSTDGPGRP